MFSFLPENLRKRLKKIGVITEIRIRANCPVIVKSNGETIKLLNCVLTESDIENIINIACKNSIYAYDKQICSGYITTDKGVRIGLAGDVVYNDNKVVTVNNVTSLSVRIPRDIVGVSNDFFCNYYKGGSVLVLSRSGVGKTTFLRDFIRNLSKNDNVDVVVIDERNEICAKSTCFSFNLGDNVDVITYSNKNYGFNLALRTLNAGVIVTDEICSINDVTSVINAIFGGTSVIASVHANNVSELKSRLYVKPLFTNNAFDYYVVLSIEGGIRKFQYYDKYFNKL